MKRAIVYTDGASSGNPGASGIGVVIEFGRRHYQHSSYIGIATNNVAEYAALIHGLEEARRLGAEEVEVYMDSELVVKQLNGQYRVKNPGLKPLYQQAAALAGSFRRATFTHIPREENKQADNLAKQAVEKGKTSPEQEESDKEAEPQTRLF